MKEISSEIKQELDDIVNSLSKSPSDVKKMHKLHTRYEQYKQEGFDVQEYYVVYNNYITSFMEGHDHIVSN